MHACIIFYFLLYHIFLLFVAAVDVQSDAAHSLKHINIWNATCYYYYRRLLVCCFTKAVLHEALSPLRCKYSCWQSIQCVTLLMAGNVVPFPLSEGHSHTVVHRMLMGVSVWYKKKIKPLMGKKEQGLGVFSVSVLTWQTPPNADGDKLLAAESVSREQRRTLKLLEGRGKKLCSQAINVRHCRVWIPSWVDQWLTLN